MDPKPGHIPGALSAPTTENLGPDGVFRSPAELAERFAALGIRPGAKVGVYCGSGVTAAHETVALALAGVDDVVLYPGSWSQWATIDGRPVATGPAPQWRRDAVPPSFAVVAVASAASLLCRPPEEEVPGTPAVAVMSPGHLFEGAVIRRRRCDRDPIFP